MGRGFWLVVSLVVSVIFMTIEAFRTTHPLAITAACLGWANIAACFFLPGKRAK